MKFMPVIAIDGPSGSGKSSLAKDLAKSLGILHIDTGAMFRTLAYLSLKDNIDCSQDAALGRFLDKLKLEYFPRPGIVMRANGQDLDQEIRTEEISLLASKISTFDRVRNYLLNFQRELASKRFSVMEGRDIGTVVFPQALIKFFITASPEERAKRRFLQLQNSGKAQNLSMSQVLQDVIKRDEQDQNRALAPLKQATDAILIDTTNMNYQEVLKLLEEYCHKAMANSGMTFENPY
jgi:CMP/dCMP kinase